MNFIKCRFPGAYDVYHDGQHYGRVYKIYEKCWRLSPHPNGKDFATRKAAAEQLIKSGGNNPRPTNLPPCDPGCPSGCVEAEAPSVAAIEDRLAFNRGWVWDGSSITFSVSLTDTAALIGTSTLMRIDPEHRNAMLSLWIAPGYRGDGYGTEAAAESIRYGFDTLGLHQIYAIRLQENQLSAKLMKRLGMRQKGAMEEFVCHNGTYHDCILHAIMKQDIIP